MTGLQLAEALANLASAKQKIDAFFAKIESVTPDALKADEAAARAELEAALEAISLPNAQQAMNDAVVVLKRLKGPIGGGYSAFLA